MMKRSILFAAVGAIVTAVFFTMPGCASINTENVAVFADLIDKINARGSGVVDDPALKFFVYTEHGVGVRIDGVHAQGSGLGPSADE